MIAALLKERLRTRLLKITGVDFNGRTVRGNCERGDLRATSTARPFMPARAGRLRRFCGRNALRLCRFQCTRKLFLRGRGMSALCQKRTWQLLRLYVDLLLNNNRKCERKCVALAGL